VAQAAVGGKSIDDRSAWRFIPLPPSAALILLRGLFIVGACIITTKFQ
jgi:hypothetical protein